MTVYSTMRLLAAFLTLLILSGCSLLQPEVIVNDGPLFCDVEEPRRFSQEEIDWRAANAPWNLRRDYKTNETWDRECVPSGGE